VRLISFPLCVMSASRTELFAHFSESRPRPGGDGTGLGIRVPFAATMPMLAGAGNDEVVIFRSIVREPSRCQTHRYATKTVRNEDRSP
jgi:hypothetical protein